MFIILFLVAGLFLAPDPVYVIVEYLGKGDLKSVLIECRSKDTGTGYSNILGLSKSLSQTLVKFARDAANGMAFLSSQKVNLFGQIITVTYNT